MLHKKEQELKALNNSTKDKIPQANKFKLSYCLSRLIKNAIRIIVMPIIKLKQEKEPIIHEEKQRELTPDFWERHKLVMEDLESGMLEQDLGINLNDLEM